MSEWSEEQLDKALEELPRREAPPGWQARLWAEIDAREKKRGLRWGWFPAIGFAAAAAVLLLLWWRRPDPAREIALRTEIEAGEVVRRGASADVGDTWIVTATLDPGAPWDLRVYRDRSLVTSCKRGGCVTRANGIELRTPLDEAGEYRALVLWGTGLPAETGTLDDDVAAANQAHVRTKLSLPLRVAPAPR